MPNVTHEEIEKRLGYHASTPESIEKHKKIRGLMIEVGDFINDVLPEGREKALAFTHLQELSMWSNAAVACNETPLTLNQ